MWRSGIELRSSDLVASTFSLFSLGLLLIFAFPCSSGWSRCQFRWHCEEERPGLKFRSTALMVLLFSVPRPQLTPSLICSFSFWWSRWRRRLAQAHAAHALHTAAVKHRARSLQLQVCRAGVYSGFGVPGLELTGRLLTAAACWECSLGTWGGGVRERAGVRLWQMGTAVRNVYPFSTRYPRRAEFTTLVRNC